MKGTLEEEMFPGGWNSQIETSNTEYYPGPVQIGLEKKEIIPGGWNSHRDRDAKEQFSREKQGQTKQGQNRDNQE